ncbi:type I-F CRISPR-associated helicase Cas3 [Aggregatibacter actinomycetemcomitans]|uniref:type I-F CRISPR-associated helicase Cas3f n=1 Tax=Aggregatibacter actinomycetemcomitans TaxID=714 RepID=UPI00197BE600|nr:type I-F CRISPR-associated helicase Cas3f [Aggregatibacter actinomycetemcomitans]MBN6069743.1 type I-F CRISPR-associated helicase Cas3 [Aggregatibacter actinomycetemcomitans]
MNILLVSQCQKNALTETRRILDQFAERCGDRVWQTPITQAGLETLHKMLRQTARKNTAVACYWTHGKNLTELLWIVGDKSQFNEEGRVPTNRTKRNILRTEDEGGWLQAYSIQIVTALAALLHDLGKANKAFQLKLKPNVPFHADYFRHEWISARLFEAMIAGCKTDQEWLSRLANWAEYKENWLASLNIDDNEADFSHLPPLARTLIWLITSHHRLPFFSRVNSREELKEKTQRDIYLDRAEWNAFYRFQLYPTEQWVKNPQSTHPNKKQFWQFEHLATDSLSWQKAMSRWTKKALNHPTLLAMDFSDPFFLLVSRLCLMVGDHHYSSLAADVNLGDKDFREKLIANTDKNHRAKQALDEHLLGVCKTAVYFSRLLPKLKAELPAVKQHKPFVKRTSIPRFQWQNAAFDLAKSIRTETEKCGLFSVNLASTGCGKTLGNARIMYALADPQKGARFTAALGLRVLTLQTGSALQEKLSLTDDLLAVLVGGSAVKKLYELQQSKENNGSESTQPWFAENEVYGADFIDSAIEDEKFAAILQDPKARKLFYAPIVTCTIDHLIGAGETARGGKYIVPMLRLLTADLILDEPDDFNQEDLPALSRLVHLAGLFGSRVLLSSATLTPDFVAGLFRAYQAGREIYNRQQGLTNRAVCCAWFDEFKQTSVNCTDPEDFVFAHQKFVEKRAEKLRNASVRRKAQIMPLPPLKKIENQLFDVATFAEFLVQQAIDLHHAHSEYDPVTQKQISFGLIRFANIKPMIPLAKQLFQMEMKPEWQDYQIHLCCYHSKQLLILRSRLEEKLDRILNRTNSKTAFAQLEVMTAVVNSQAKHQLFLVVGSPVTEVGRDHDYDWAIVDPSSMRSIIQLAGRVWRHRPEKIAQQPNIALLPTNWRGLAGQTGAIFNKPGFEDAQHSLETHRTEELIPAEQLARIDSIPRIIKRADFRPHFCLADLEHQATADLLNNPQINCVNAYWNNALSNRFTANLPLMTRFRKSRTQSNIVCLLDEDGKPYFREQESAWETPDNPQNTLPEFRYRPLDGKCGLVKPWLDSSLRLALAELAERLGEESLLFVALKYATVSLADDDTQWCFNETLGFWQED